MLAQLHRLRHGFSQGREDRLYDQITHARDCLPGLHDRVANRAASWPWQGDDPGDPPIPDRRAGRGADPGDTAGIVLADRAGNGLVMLQSVFQPLAAAASTRPPAY